MKIKNLLLVVVLSAICVNLQAKTEESTRPIYVENSYWSNWFVGAGVGTMLYFGDGESAGDFSGRFSPALNFSVGKWITPNIGMRLEYTGFGVNGYTRNGSLSSAGDLNSDGTYDQYWRLNSVRGDIMFNLNSIIDGCYRERIFTTVPYVGFGFVHNKTNKIDELAFNAGLQNNMRVTDALSLNLDIKGILVKDKLDGEEGGRAGEGILAVTFGVTYRFKSRGWSVYEPSKVAVTSTAYEPKLGATGWRLQQTSTPGKLSEDLANASKSLAEKEAQLAELQAESKKLRGQLNKTKKQLAQKPVEIKEGVLSSGIVFFNMGSSKLTKKSQVILSYVADALKADQTDKVFSVVGHADSAVGSVEVNDKISKQRAEVVYNALVNEFGVAKEKLQLVHKGGTDAMFYNTPELNRAVIIE